MEACGGQLSNTAPEPFKVRDHRFSINGGCNRHQPSTIRKPPQYHPQHQQRVDTPHRNVLGEGGLACRRPRPSLVEVQAKPNGAKLLPSCVRRGLGNRGGTNNEHVIEVAKHAGIPIKVSKSTLQPAKRRCEPSCEEAWTKWAALVHTRAAKDGMGLRILIPVQVAHWTPQPGTRHFGHRRRTSHQARVHSPAPNRVEGVRRIKGQDDRTRPGFGAHSQILVYLLTSAWAPHPKLHGASRVAQLGTIDVANRTAAHPANHRPACKGSHSAIKFSQRNEACTQGRRHVGLRKRAAEHQKAERRGGIQAGRIVPQGRPMFIPGACIVAAAAPRVVQDLPTNRRCDLLIVDRPRCRGALGHPSRSVREEPPKLVKHANPCGNRRDSGGQPHRPADRTITQLTFDCCRCLCQRCRDLAPATRTSKAGVTPEGRPGTSTCQLNAPEHHVRKAAATCTPSAPMG